jgi:hypothetical protein
VLLRSSGHDAVGALSERLDIRHVLEGGEELDCWLKAGCWWVVG